MVKLLMKNEIIALHRQGVSNRAISRRLGISRNTTNKYVKEFIKLIKEKDIYELTDILKHLENGTSYKLILSKKEETIEDKSLNQLNEISNLYTQGELIQ